MEDTLALLEKYHADKNYRGLLSKINKNEDLKKDVLLIFDKFSFNVTLSEGIYLHLHNLTEPPKCLVCNKEVKFKNSNVGYFKTCSVKCAQTSDLTLMAKRESCKKKYGVEHHTQRESYKNILKEKIKNNDFGFTSQGFKNYLKNNNVINVSQISDIKDKVRLTVKNKSVEEKQKISNKICATNMAKYGVKNTYELATRFLYKEVVTPSGCKIKLQGYEDVGYKKLMETYEETDIIFKRKDVPVFLYIDDNKERKYYPDFWIKKDNLIIEIKSKWTFNIRKDINMKKIKSAIDAGYNAQIWICSKTSVTEIFDYKIEITKNNGFSNLLLEKIG